MQKYEQDLTANDSDDAQKNRLAEQRAIAKRKVKTHPGFIQSSLSTVSKAPSFQFSNASFQNGNSSPIPSDSPERPKVQTPAWVAAKVQQRDKTD